jgi:membrane protease YdiL (CAAX protease family)
MTSQDRVSGFWLKLPVWVRAIVSGLLIAMVAANVWPLLLLKIGVPLAVIAELLFLALYVWWAGGEGPPQKMRTARITAFRKVVLPSKQWMWSLIAAFFFAATVHSAIVLLFRFVSYPMAAFRQGYDISFVPSYFLRWLAIVVSAASAGICEETGFRGYMQRPLEQCYGAPTGLLISSLCFTLVHMPKGWATAAMVPIVFGAGLLLGLLAWASNSLLPSMIGHILMDIGLFAYWWTGIAGEFTARPITETGIDRAFVVACAALVISFLVVLIAIARVRRERG